MAALAGEYQAFPTTFEQVRAGGDLGTTPLVVLTAAEILSTVGSGRRRLERATERACCALDQQHTHRHTSSTTHDSLVYQQQAAQATVDAIVDLVSTLRTE